MVTPFKLVVEGTQTVQSEMQQLAGYLSVDSILEKSWGNLAMAVITICIYRKQAEAARGSS